MNCCIPIKNGIEKADSLGLFAEKKEKKEWDNVYDDRTKIRNSFTG